LSLGGWILENDAYTLRLPPGSVKTIGRTARADFIITGALVSRLHCRVTADRSGQLVVEDLESTNGILVNGEAAERAVLRDGDKLTVGRVEFKVKEVTGAAGN
jgi:pSer/pThr/pTyr-binding forkhead associated (FHA) protein